MFDRLRETFAESVTTVRRSPRRTVASAVATAIGVAAYMGFSASTDVAQRQIEQRFAKLRPTSFTIAVPADSPAKVTTSSISALAERVPGTAAVGLAPVRIKRRSLTVRRLWYSGSVDAPIVDNADLFVSRGQLVEASSGALAWGRAFDAGHLSRADPVIMLGSQLAEDLGVKASADTTVVLESRAFRVIGVIRRLGANPDLLGAAFVPRSSLERYWPTAQIGSETIRVRTSADAVRPLAKDAPLVLAPNAPGRLNVAVPPDPRSLQAAVGRDVNQLGGTIAVLSLLVGAISIGGATFVSVLERRPEYGLRRALGARSSDIASATLFEAVFTAGLGSLAGLAIGATYSTARFAQEGLTPSFDERLIVAAPVVGIIVGVVAGIAPAIYAARIEPIEALRA